MATPNDRATTGPVAPLVCGGLGIGAVLAVVWLVLRVDLEATPTGRPRTPMAPDVSRTGEQQVSRRLSESGERTQDSVALPAAPAETRDQMAWLEQHMPGLPTDVAQALARDMEFRLPPGDVEFVRGKYRHARNLLAEILADLDSDMQREAMERAIPPGDPLLVTRARLAVDFETRLALLAALQEGRAFTLPKTPTLYGLEPEADRFHHEVFGFDQGAWDGYLVISVPYGDFARLRAAREHQRAVRRDALLLRVDQFNRLPTGEREKVIRGYDLYLQSGERNLVDDRSWRKRIPEGARIDRNRWLLAMG